MSHGMSYHVDVVFCIDATQSMAPRFSRVKEHVNGFASEIQAYESRRGKYIDALRVRVIAFRDYKDRTTVPIQQSAFFSLPAEADAFRSYVASIHASGGITGAPKSGLEALTIAMQSAWTTGGDKRRHIIVLWTDGEAHLLEKRPKPAGYPSNILSNYNELADLWHGQLMDARAKRLVIFAPETTPWSDIATHWNQVIYLPSQAGKE